MDYLRNLKFSHKFTKYGLFSTLQALNDMQTESQTMLTTATEAEADSPWNPEEQLPTVNS